MRIRRMKTTFPGRAPVGTAIEYEFSLGGD
jgi:hypothetical protein